MTDTERLDFLLENGLYAAPNDFGEWQVREASLQDGAGCVNRNAIFSSAHDAIDCEMSRREMHNAG